MNIGNKPKTISLASVLFLALFMNQAESSGPRHPLGALPDNTPPTHTLAPALSAASSAYAAVPVLPTELNYVTQGAVTPIRDQGQCGSCTIFAVTAAVEAYFLRTQQLSLDLSEQRVLGCQSTTMSICNYGYVTTKVGDYYNAIGTTLDKVIPYKGIDTLGCNLSDTSLLTSSNFPYKTTETATAIIAMHNAADLKLALFNYGPVATTFIVMEDFFNYTSGVYAWDHASATAGGHAVLVVGYSDSKQAFLVKNSWGTGWGMGGYVWMSYSQMAPPVNFGVRDSFVIAVTAAATPNQANSFAAIIESLYGKGVESFVFGSSPTAINNQLVHKYSDVSWSKLPIATEFTNQDVRFMQRPLSDFSGLPYQDLYQSCVNDGSYLEFLFTQQGLFDVSIRLSSNCAAKNSIVSNIANSYNIPVNTLATGDIGFKYSGNIIFSGQTNKAAATASIDWVSKSLPIPNPLAIAYPTSLPAGTIGIAYPNTAVTPSGGTAPYKVTVTGLPAGLSYNGANLVGTPQKGANGTSTVSISVTDASGASSVSKLVLTINQPPAVVSSANLPASGLVGVAYTGTFTATGGVGALSLTASGLPTGLSLTNGVISGTPSTAGTFSLTLTAKDSLGQTATLLKTIVISPAPNFSLAATSAALSVKIGSAVADTVTIAALNGFKSNVALSVSGLPATITPIFTPSTITGGVGSAVLKLTTTSATPLGTYQLTLTATSGTLSNKKAITLTVTK